MTTSWPRIGLLYAAGVVSAGQLGLVPPLVSVLQHDLGLSLTAAAAAVSMVTLVGAVLGLPAGRWCQAAGHSRALVAGLAIMAVAAVLSATAENGGLLLAARGLAGVGYLLVVIAAPSLMAALAEPRHHAFVLSLWGTFVPVGMAVVGFIAAGFAETGWRTMFLFDAAALATASTIVLASVRAPVTSSRLQRHALPVARLVTAAPLSLAFFCFALLFLALAGLLPAYFVDRRGLAPAEAGRIVGVATAFGIAGSLAAAWLMRRGLAPVRLLAVGLVSSTIVAVLSLNAALPLALSVACCVLSFALGGLGPAATFAAVPRLAGDAHAIGPINGMVAQAGSLGSLAGPPVLALWIEWTSWAWAPVLLIAIAIVGAALALVVIPSSRPP